MKVFIIGGAGFIGANLVNELTNFYNYEIFVIDNLSKQHNILPTKNVHFVNIDIHKDLNALVNIFKNGTDDKIVIHLAGKKIISESLLNPDLYWSNNFKGTQNVIQAMRLTNINSIIFSSSASVYGNSDGYIDELTPINPLSPYAEIKLFEERIIEQSGLNYAIFRFFNVGGAGGNHLKERFGHNVFSNVLRCIETKDTFKIYGDDHNTFDGTLIRDYVHVNDICKAITLAIPLVQNNILGTMNLSSGNQYSIKNIIEEVKNHSTLNVAIYEKNEYDPIIFVGKSNLAESILGWKSSKNLKDIVESILN